jgi:hypothetical protein
VFPEESDGLTRPRGRYGFLAAAGLLGLVGVFYLRPEILSGAGQLAGMDYYQLHIRRIQFARQALFGKRHSLPGWYPHEVMGMPFAANMQSFPWIPTRLILLLLDPSVAYAAGVTIAAALSALFTYLYCRRAGMTRTGAVASGGTFACAGYFASRVLAGHLPLLEAYPALPLLLWLVDRALTPEREIRRRFDLTVLSLCSACVLLAGHPQLPAYALVSAVFYAVWMGRGWLRARTTAALIVGGGLAMAAWWPMLLLIARSTRVLALAAPANDISMPYSRLLALVLPAIHGFPPPVDLADISPFRGYPNNAYFWDTASYVGLLPLMAIATLLGGCLFGRRLPERRWIFLFVLGTGALLCSLPLAGPILHLLPGTLLRSPARLLYLSTFCAAVALGAGVDAFQQSQWPARAGLRTGLVAAALSLHFVDLWSFSHRFIQVIPREAVSMPFQGILDRQLDNGRIAQEWSEPFWLADRYDDLGGFDSIFLARFDRGLLALAGNPPDLNRQRIDASELPITALEAASVKFVLMTDTRSDLELVSSNDDGNLYRVANPAPRVHFFTTDDIEYATARAIPELFATVARNHRTKLLLPVETRSYSEPSPRLSGSSRQGEAEIDYSRLSSDEILLQTKAEKPGYAYVVEAYDSGWSATVDQRDVPILPANGFAMAAFVPAGQHTVRLRYRTPGRATGEVLSLLSLGLLAGLIASTKPRVPQEAR